MNSLSSKKEAWLAVILAAYCAYYLSVSLVAFWGFTTDDAYISWLYARQLAQGEGLNWPAVVPRVEGYSNFLWVVIAAWVIKMHWPVALAMKWISVVGLGAGLLFLYRLSRLFLSPLLAILPVFIFSHYPGVVWWTVSGLESALFCSLSILLIWQCAVAFGFTAVNDQATTIPVLSTQAWVVTNLTLLLLGLTRFEGVVWGLPVCFFIWCQWTSHRFNYVNLTRKKMYAWALITLICFVLPYAVYFGWRLYYFGALLPNSYRCKAFVTGQVGVVDLDYIGVIISLIVASVPYFLSTDKDCRHVLLWLPSLVYGIMLWNADPILAHYLRLFLGPFALVSLLSVLGIYQFFHYFNYSLWDLKLMSCCVILIFTFAFIPGNHLSSLRALSADYQGRNQNRIMIAQLLNERAAIGATVLLGDCGLIPFNARSDLRFIDSQCLNNAALTQAPYYGNLVLYSDYIRQQMKSDWIIAAKPVLEARGDFLMALLQRKGFFKEYQLVARLQSGARVPASQGTFKRTVDYVYEVYKRK